MWSGRRVVLGVSGGIAAYKSVLVARELARLGAQVDVVMTAGASRFVGVPTFEAVTRRKVYTSLWEPGTALDHVSLGDGADLVIVAPATASLLARAAQGIADDLLTALLLATGSPVLAAPAMNDRMYASEATGSNISRLAERGWHFVGPATGDLAEGPSELPGRLSEPVEIIAHAGRVISTSSDWRGRQVTITAGPTRESIDPVRVITNRSSGRMGYRLAEAAWRRGAVVTLISGPSTESPPVGVELIPVETTHDMAEAVNLMVPATDVLIMAAAPADYRPATARETKLPRSEGGFSLPFESTDDILLGTLPLRHGGLITVGFALETGTALEKGMAKLERKQLDLIVINDALEPGAGFEVETNAVTILDARGRAVAVPLASKAAVADRILDAVAAYRG